MKRIVADSVSDVDADILILGSLTVFSACIPNVYGVYDRREVFANLFLFVTARASAGKGRLTLCRHLVAPIHQALRDKYREQMKKYEAAQASFMANRKDALAVQPQEPPFLTLLVPANSTATVVYQTLPRKTVRAFKNHHPSVTTIHQKFLASLPDSFDRQTYLKTAAALNIPAKTAERYVADFCKSGQLSHPAHDLYTKVAL